MNTEQAQIVSSFCGEQQPTAYPKSSRCELLEQQQVRKAAGYSLLLLLHTRKANYVCLPRVQQQQQQEEDGAE